MIKRPLNFPKQLNIRLSADTYEYLYGLADTHNSTPGTLARQILEREANRDLQPTEDLRGDAA
jgi:predicted DNA-binding protein